MEVGLMVVGFGLFFIVSIFAIIFLGMHFFGGSKKGEKRNIFQAAAILSDVRFVVPHEGIDGKLLQKPIPLEGDRKKFKWHPRTIFGWLNTQTYITDAGAICEEIPVADCCGFGSMLVVLPDKNHPNAKWARQFTQWIDDLKHDKNELKIKNKRAIEALLRTEDWEVGLHLLEEVATSQRRISGKERQIYTKREDPLIIEDSGGNNEAPQT